MAIEWTQQYDKSEARWKALCEVGHIIKQGSPLK